MEWLNIFGLIFVMILMIPNIVFAMKCKDGFENKWNNRIAEALEQVGRFGCFGFMTFNIPGTWFGWWSDEAFALSILPSILFLFSGIMSRSVLLIISAVLFAPSQLSFLIVTQNRSSIYPHRMRHAHQPRTIQFLYPRLRPKYRLTFLLYAR